MILTILHSCVGRLKFFKTAIRQARVSDLLKFKYEHTTLPTIFVYIHVIWNIESNDYLLNPTYPCPVIEKLNPLC